jgi:hypothetical protein
MHVSEENSFPSRLSVEAGFCSCIEMKKPPARGSGAAR